MRALVVLAALAVAPAHADAPAAIKARGLSRGEVALLRPVFGDSVDYGAVVITDARLPLQPADTYMTPRGTVHAPGKLWRDDWAHRRVPLFEKAELVHEIAHVWQHAQGIDVVAASVDELVRTRGRYHLAYAYVLDGRDLAAYSIEQQASLIADYFVLVTKRAPAADRRPYERALAQFLASQTRRAPRAR